MLFSGWDVRIGENCERGLQNNACIFKSEVIAFYPNGPTQGQLTTCLCFPLSQINFTIVGPFHTHRTRVTLTVVKGRKIRTVQRTSEIAEFVTVSS